MYFKGKKIQGIFYTSQENKTGMQFFRKGTEFNQLGFLGNFILLWKSSTLCIYLFFKKNTFKWMS